MTEIKDREQIELYRPGIERLDVSATALIVEDGDGAGHGADLLSGIQSEKKRIDTARRALVSPLNDHVKFINAGFRPLSDLLDECEKTVKRKMLTYHEEVEREVQEQRRRLAQEAERKAAEEEEAARKKIEAEASEAGFTEEESKELGDLEVEDVKDRAPVFNPLAAVVEPDTTVRTETASATVRKVWTYKIVNPDSVPRAYLIVDERAIMAAVRSGVRQMTGVRIFQKSTLAGGR